MATSRGLSFNGQLFFVYNREAVTKEEDAPEDAIIYFSPSSATMESRISICGQLVGISNFLSTVLDFAPVLITLKSEKVALCQSGQYTLALGGSISEPESLLTKQLEALFSIFVFYHGSFDTVYNLSKDHESFLNIMSSIWDCYLPFIRHYGDTLPAVFDPLPFLKAPKNSSGCFLKASHILQTCQRRHHILGGCILYKKSVLCSQLESCITRRLLLLEPKQCHLPAMQGETEIKLPYGVRILHSFVTVSEYQRLLKELLQSPYHHSRKETLLQQQQQQASNKNISYNGQAEGNSFNYKISNTSNSRQENEQSTQSCLGNANSTVTTSIRNEKCSSSDNEKDCIDKVLAEDTVFKETDGELSASFKPGVTINDLQINTFINDNNCEPSVFDNEDCFSELDKEHLTMDEIDIRGLHIVKTDSKENVQQGRNGQDISELKIKKLPDSHTEEVKICSELIDSLLEQVSIECENSAASTCKTDDSCLNDSITQEENSNVNLSAKIKTRSATAVQQSTTTGTDLSDLNSDTGHNILPVTTEARPSDLSGLIFNGNQAANTRTKLQEECETSPTEEFHDTFDIAIDRFEEIRSVIVEKTVSAILKEFHKQIKELKEKNLTATKYSASNLDQPENNKVVKNLFKDLIGQEGKSPMQTLSDSQIKQQNPQLSLSQSQDLLASGPINSRVSPVLHESASSQSPGRPQENSRMSLTLHKSGQSPIMDRLKEYATADATVQESSSLQIPKRLKEKTRVTHDDSGPSHATGKPDENAGANTRVHGSGLQENTRVSPDMSSPSQKDDGRESGLSCSIPSESPPLGYPEDDQASLGDSGLCLFNGTTEHSLSLSENGTPSKSSTISTDGITEFSSTLKIDASSSNTTDAGTVSPKQKQDGQNDYPDDMKNDLYQIDGLMHINLYVQAHSNTVLILLADASLSTDQETIKALWKTTLNELGNLEVHLNQLPEDSKQAAPPEDFSFLVYEAINTTTKGNLKSEPVLQIDHKFCETAKTVHEQFTNCTSLKAITLRDSYAAVHCQRSLGQEVYLHKKGPLKQYRGTPGFRDSAFMLERRARKQLRKQHGINMF